MLYRLTVTQSNNHRGIKSVEIPDGYSVISEGDIIIPGTLVYFGDTNKEKPWQEIAEYNFGQPIRNNIGIYIAPLPKMDKWETLVIRICKGSNRFNKINMIRRALAKRSRMSIRCIEDQFLFEYLCDLANKYKPFNTKRYHVDGMINFICDASPSQAWKCGGDDKTPYFIRFAMVLVCRIVMTEGKDLIGYIPHAAFRNSQKTS